jgi:hypothetical protein
MNLFNLGEPFFVSEEGTKWWRDEDMEKYASNPDVHGTTLSGWQCFIAETANGRMDRLVFDENKNLVYVGGSLEAAATKIDMAKVNKRFDKEKQDVYLTRSVC